MFYSLLRPFLFRFDAEKAHYLTLNSLQTLHKLNLTSCVFPKITAFPQTIMGLNFPNPVGLAAGLDKNGAYIDALAQLGFGFIEIGTVTPRVQSGNPQPRMFRLPEADAIINRLGFNNLGVEQLIENVKKSTYRGILGINIGKNADTPIEKAQEDYLLCMRKVYSYASYITINISSPNTSQLRHLQDDAQLDALLTTLKQEQTRLADTHSKYVPLILKIAPDLDSTQISAIAKRVVQHRFDAIIATNTTTNREAVNHLLYGNESGGLSGKPLFEKSTTVLHELHTLLKGEVPLIGVGGILNGQNAQQKIKAGACLVQIYTGLIYRGPELIKEMVKEIIAGDDKA